MSNDLREMLAILQHNAGFDNPALWIDYARRHGFTRVKAVKVARCPDCSAHPAGSWGQYVYYSTLFHLLECRSCGLIWADAHIDPVVLRRHFEVSYKDDRYFRESRKAIFEHLAAVIDRLAPIGGRILDIGGARGDLMHKVAARRSDVQVTLNDISPAATAWVATRFGFATVTGDADELASHSGQYDVVVLSDVLYYEPKLNLLWSALSRLICPGGAIVIRVPNKLLLIWLGQLWLRLWRPRERLLLQDNVPYFNPEHLFVLSRRYLTARLRSIGFMQARVLPSPLLQGSMPSAIESSIFRVASVINKLSLGTFCLTPSVLVIGTGRQMKKSHQGRDALTRTESGT